jgi:hypothetical protein
MDRDTFIITVYCLVVQLYPQVVGHERLRARGFIPELTDEEVITMEICGEYFKHSTDKDLFDYFSQHYRHFFPALSERTRFVRQAADLWQVKAGIQQRLTILSGQASEPVQVIDTLPLPVCTYTRAGRDHCFKLLAGFGYCAAKKLHYYGFKLGLRVSRWGMIIDYPLLSASPHDINHLGALIEGASGLIPADKGFIDDYQQRLWAARQGVEIITPPRARMSPAHSPAVLKTCRRWRKVVETVGSHLTERFAVTRIRVHDLWHYQHRLIRKVLAHTVGVFLNLQMGRQPLDLDGLLTCE